MLQVLDTLGPGLETRNQKYPDNCPKVSAPETKEPSMGNRIHVINVRVSFLAYGPPLSKIDSKRLRIRLYHDGFNKITSSGPKVHLSE
jgi:hypothetical protein